MIFSIMIFQKVLRLRIGFEDDFINHELQYQENEQDGFMMYTCWNYQIRNHHIILRNSFKLTKFRNREIRTS
jgi:hypothetical protein